MEQERHHNFITLALWAARKVTRGKEIDVKDSERGDTISGEDWNKGIAYDGLEQRIQKDLASWLFLRPSAF